MFDTSGCDVNMLTCMFCMKMVEQSNEMEVMEG
jgi:hypothetical protein